MLYVFCGNDTVGVRQKAHDFIATYENDGVRVERIDSDTFESGVLQDAVGATSLFGDETLYLVDTPSTKKEMYENVVENLSVLGESGNTFVVIEGALLAPEKKKFQKHAESLEEVKGEKSERFNAFGMADALANKDKKILWVLFGEAKLAGLSNEEIIGTLWWQLKSMRLAATTSSATEAGMKDYSYNKAKRALSKFKDGEVEKLSHDLLSVYHDGHLGKKDIDIALEKWTLTV